MSGLRIEVELSRGDFALRSELSVSPGSPLALVGPNGAGKTTLLRAVLGTIEPRRGHIRVGEQIVFDSVRGIDVPTEQRRLGYVPQDYGLFPHLDVLGNVRFGLDSRRPDWSSEGRDSRAHDLLQRFHLDRLSDRKPDNLSGGERQRVALARALASDPDALLLDEPLAALDVSARRRVRDWLAEHLRNLSLPTLLVTHDPADVDCLAENTVVLEHGETRPVSEKAPSDFTREFFG